MILLLQNDRQIHTWVDSAVECKGPGVRKGTDRRRASGADLYIIDRWRARLLGCFRGTILPGAISDGV